MLGVVTETLNFRRIGGLVRGGESVTKRSAVVMLLAAATLLLGSCSKKTPTLNLLVWEGYADPSFVHAFEEQNHCKVSASYMGSSDELVAKLRGGSAGTLRCDFAVERRGDDDREDTGWRRRSILSKLPSYTQLSRQLTSLPLVKVNGKYLWRAVHVGARSSDL